jgi:2-dehydropantoate 2-reductase
MKEIAVMGGGALGLLLAGKLAAAGHAVTLWTRTKKQAVRVGLQGITIECLGQDTPLVVQVNALPAEEVPSGFCGHVLLTVKQTAITSSLLGFLTRTVSDHAAVTLFQNGIGHIEPVAAALPGRQLLAAVTTEGALRTGISSVRHTGKGETWIGQPLVSSIGWAQSASYEETLVRVMKQAGFSVFVSNSIRERMLRKLLINAVINPLTALWRVTNGELPASSDRRIVMHALFRETAEILKSYGLQGTESPELWKNVLGVCSSTADNRSSMLQDVLAGRETEINALNGAICRMAESEGKEAPWNAVVTALVKAILLPEERGE